MRELDGIDPKAVVPQFVWMVWLCGHRQPGAQVRSFVLNWLQVSWAAEGSAGELPASSFAAEA